MDHPQLKTCRKCKETKHLDAFYNSKKSYCTDGKLRRCKSCCKEFHRYHNMTLEQKETKKLIAKECRYTNLSIEQKRLKWRTTQNKYLSKHPDRRIKSNLRSRLHQVIIGRNKTYSAVKDLGCSWEHFKEHIQSKFTEGMTWDNYGEWHIDHIFPLAKVNIANPEELKTAIHYTNLQPLWALDNILKSDKIT